MAIPDFRDDGFLPIGLHKATEAEVAARFGQATPKRQELLIRLHHWLRLARAVKAERFVVGGSFISSRPDPDDLDCLCWLPRDFEQQYQWGKREAVELYQIIAAGYPKELFGVLLAEGWDYFTGVFRKIEERPGEFKGMIEVLL
jgi:uncharacterized protein DUF6932